MPNERVVEVDEFETTDPTMRGEMTINTAGPTPGAFWSSDGGHSWHGTGPLPLPRGASGGDNASVAFNRNGTGFVVAGSMTENENQRGVYLWRTTNGGRSFSKPTAVAAGEFVDHPWLAIDPGPGSGGDDLYVAWVTRHGSDEGVAFSRSADGGHSFTRQRIIARPAGGVTAPVATAGPNGAVYVAYFTVTQRQNAVMQVVSSTDHGAKTRYHLLTTDGGIVADQPGKMAGEAAIGVV